MFVHDAIMDAIASGSTEVAASELFEHFKHLTDLNGKEEEYLENDFKVTFKVFLFEFLCDFFISISEEYNVINNIIKCNIM